jgi:hypothetical protein
VGPLSTNREVITARRIPLSNYNALDVKFNFWTCSQSYSRFYDSITVRQTVDPCHEIADLQYIAQSRVTLPENGCLDLSKLGVGKPGDLFLVSFLVRFSAFSLYVHLHCRRESAQTVPDFLANTPTLSTRRISDIFFSMGPILTRSLL